MKSIQPPAQAWRDSVLSTALFSTTYEDKTASIRTYEWLRLLPQPNIPNCIPISKLRCIIPIVSFALLMTDIPRTGLGIQNLREYYPVPLMPSTAFALDLLTILSYMYAVKAILYDTTSVGLRGAVELLNVTEFPDVLLYKPSQDQPATNPDSLLNLRTAFTMLDAFISAAQSELRPAHKKIPTTMRFATKHNWVDRVHHYVVRFASKNPAWRLHSLHVPLITPDTQSLAICSNAGVAKQTSPRPRFCNHPGIWKCKHPLDASLPAVRLWDHMDLRFRAFKQRYPDLELDVALVSSQRLSSTSGAMRSTFYNYEALEVVVLTRGRRCADNVDNENVSASSCNGTKTCTTVFVDDYRYERDIVQTNLVDWYGIISMLRGSAQAYVWIRAALLIYGAYVVAEVSLAGQRRCSNSRLVAIALIVFKIPFQVVVYSSLFPVACYVAALLLDSSFMDIFLDSYWASVAGSINFQLIPFLKTTAVQMRNVWVLALLASLVVFAVRKTRDHWNDGIPGVRGLVIGFTSTLTVAGPFKKNAYRDTNILQLFRVANAGQTTDIVYCNPGGYFNASSSRASGVTIPPHQASHTSIGQEVSSPTADMIPTFSRLQTKILPVQSQIVPSNNAVARTSRRNTRGTHCRTTELRSVVQLMNVAMMTDPWNLLWLRILGIQLYLYKVHSSEVRSASYAIVLPFHQNQMEEFTGLSLSDYQLLDSANSRDIPIWLLFQCG
ncbi:unnamed protein product [Phytophthora lilii]|uniref:Unnamed protein product n=1 Tax=Phytophthora lilii TaxID=2077276 RepID=A0A9W6T9Q4_9STRA|nr:unnamed protein product [Phytophthora lilii]